jgi:hypothetical protein
VCRGTVAAPFGLLKLPGAHRFCEDHPLADGGAGTQWVTIREGLSGVARDEGACPALLENEGRNVCWTKHARLSDPSRHARGGPAIQQRVLRGNWRQSTRERHRARQGGDTR